jgi:hypothetical protein
MSLTGGKSAFRELCACNRVCGVMSRDAGNHSFFIAAVPQDHPLRPIKRIVEESLKGLNEQFA